MNREEVKQLILKEKLVVLYRKIPVEQVGDLVKALVRGGVKLLEVTYDQMAADPIATFKASVAAVREAVGDALVVGAGTVLTPAQVDAAYEAGATFIISPCTKQDVISRTREKGMVSIPGALTPTEIAAAWDMGADIVKLFPADDMGYHYIWNLRGPLPHIPLLASGGVNPETIPEYLKYGINAVGTGVSIVNRDMLDRGDFDGIADLARKHVEAIANYGK